MRIDALLHPGLAEASDGLEMRRYADSVAGWASPDRLRGNETMDSFDNSVFFAHNLLSRNRNEDYSD